VDRGGSNSDGADSVNRNPGEEADRASTERHPSVPIWEQKGRRHIT
jgi:hypothetical protein